jgi:hypothetical protein
VDTLEIFEHSIRSNVLWDVLFCAGDAHYTYVLVSEFNGRFRTSSVMDLRSCVVKHNYWKCPRVLAEGRLMIFWNIKLPEEVFVESV